MSPTSTPVNLKDPANSLPGMLFIDTSVLLNALGPLNVNLQRPVEAKALLRLVRNGARQGNAFAYTSTHVVEECFFKIIQGHLVQEAKRQRLGAKDWSLIYKRQPSLINTYVLSVRAFYQKLINIPVNVVDPSELTKTSASSPPIL